MLKVRAAAPTAGSFWSDGSPLTALLVQGVIDKSLTGPARKLLEEEKDPLHPGRADIGSQPEIINLINESRFAPCLEKLIGEFDRPQGTHVGVLPVNTEPPEASHLPFYNSFIHMDGLTTTGTQGGDPKLPPSSLFGNEGEEDLDLFHKHYMAYIGHGRNPGRHAENYGVNGGMLFQDPDHSLTTVRHLHTLAHFCTNGHGSERGGSMRAGLVHAVRGGVPQRSVRNRARPILRPSRLPPRHGKVL